ncbi:dihydropteroate synthase [Desulfoluna butyratoxydans]|uniref:Dihydropteroate synthase n=1 Tax=Desulfoluna butyratoxydans TaxID=231438 RepID=A0A4U8YP08_9BACT|nr:dihydropteroate synthase [Desulfoluna butyratoxydans]VFQ45886.1 dihydropteroate synthase [Desulfoluna butyratoxydans]
MIPFDISWKNHRLNLGHRTCIMGILNVTPDSFSDGGQFFNAQHAVNRARQMVEEGADIIDIGGESSRPNADPVSLEEELRRVVPVVEELVKHIDVPISVDTVKAEVARQALNAGAAIINDITALTGDPEMAKVVAEFDVPVVLMHMKGTPRTMQDSPSYHDPVGEVIAYLKEAITRAEAAGIARDKIIVDPGIGFGKTVGHNYTIIKHLKNLECLNVPVLMGTSRKSFIRKTLEEGVRIAPMDEIEIGTQATVSASIMGGAHIVRVHDVKSTAVTVKVMDNVTAAR